MNEDWRLTMKDLSWVNHPAMRNIDARKMRVIVNLLNDVEGQPIEMAIPGIMRANQEKRKAKEEMEASV